jgi:hypothetical protein
MRKITGDFQVSFNAPKNELTNRKITMKGDKSSESSNADEGGCLLSCSAV